MAKIISLKQIRHEVMRIVSQAERQNRASRAQRYLRADLEIISKVATNLLKNVQAQIEEVEI